MEIEFLEMFSVEVYSVEICSVEVYSAEMYFAEMYFVEVNLEHLEKCLLLYILKDSILYAVKWIEIGIYPNNPLEVVHLKNVMNYNVKYSYLLLKDSTPILMLDK